MLPGSFNPDDPEGVQHDALAVGRGKMYEAKRGLQDIYVKLDHLADDTEGIWTDMEEGELRLMQKTVEALIESKEDDIEDTEEKLRELQ